MTALPWFVHTLLHRPLLALRLAAGFVIVCVSVVYRRQLADFATQVAQGMLRVLGLMPIRAVVLLLTGLALVFGRAFLEHGWEGVLRIVRYVAQGG